MMRKISVRQNDRVPGIILLALLVCTSCCCSYEETKYFFTKSMVTPTDPYWLQLFPEHAPQPRSRAFMAYDPERNRIVLFGGESENNGIALSDTWEFDGADWIPIKTDRTPPARLWGGMCYVPAMHACILFGGGLLTSTQKFNDTWKYADGQWTQLFPDHHPSERRNFAMVYDDNIKRILLFGGKCNDTYHPYLGDFWSFDGSDWTLISDDPNMLGTLHGCQMVYDSSRKKTILFGGSHGLSIYNNTWEYDGLQWTKIDTPTKVLPLRENTHLTYDKFQKKTILFGGNRILPTAYYNDTWEYDGTDWTKVMPEVSPPLRSYGNFVYFDALYRSIYFGGVDGTAPGEAIKMNETWAYSAAVQTTPTLSIPLLIALLVLLSLLLVRSRHSCRITPREGEQ